MSEKADNLINQLQQYDMSSDEGRVFLYLVKHGKTSALNLSRKLKIARTKIYRLLDKLIDKGLAYEEVIDYGKKFKAANPEKLLQVIGNKERELLLLKASTPTIVGQLNKLMPVLNADTEILKYRGAEGLKQVVWNTTKVKGIFRIYEIGEGMHEFLSFEFSEKIREEFARNKSASFRQLTNHKHIGEYTNIEAHVKTWEPRYIPKSKLDIKVEVQIYNDVYAMYEYTKDDVFIVEIYNKELAEMQKQIYDLIWEGAVKMEKLGKKGEARVIE